MNTFFDWLSNNSLATTAFIIIFALLFLLVIIVYLVSFFQGRSLSFWPPKIGERPSNKGTSHANNFNEVKDIKSDDTETIVKNKHIGLPNVKLDGIPIAQVIVVEGPEKGTIYLIQSGIRKIIVGSSKDCDISLSPEMLTVSRIHFKIIISPIEGKNHRERDYKFELFDTSVNGTFINGKMVNQAEVVGML
jgi:Na+-transporting methylmalonyl-CoA/oxaloacetate decarboxylase gamma subunit